MNGPITKEELSLLDRCKTVEEWDAAVVTIRRAHDGNYPWDWFTKVMKSGLADMIFKRWGGKPQMTLPGFE